MTRRTVFSRRTMLRGMLGGAGVALGLPLLDVMLDEHGEALADGSALPARFGLWWWGNGNHPDRWTPTATGPSYALTSPLLPLLPVQSDILLVTGLEIKVPNNATHRSGRAGLLTGLPSTPDTPTWYSNRTVDRQLADATSAGLPFRSLDTALGPEPGTVSAEGPFTTVQGATSPAELYEKLFSVPVTPGGSEALAARIALRRSALDVIMEDARRLRTRVGAHDRARVEEHFDNVRAYEQLLANYQTSLGSGNVCTPEPIPDDDGSETLSDARKLEVNRLMARGLGVALSCDLTRVFTHQFSRPGGDVRYLGVADGHHSLTHFEPGAQPTVSAILDIIMRGLSEFIAELRAVRDGAGSLLDSMVMLATSEVSEGRTHSLRDMPVILAGNAHGALRTGEHVAVPPRTNASDLMLTLMRRSGLQLASFGEDTAYSDRELSEILS